MTNREKAFEYKKQREQDGINYFCNLKSNNQIEIENTVMDNKFFAYDNIILSGGTQYASEIKIRLNYSYNAIKSLGGQLLEKQKLERINEQLVKDNVDFPILYFIFFKDRLCIYKLSDNVNHYLWQSKLLPKDNFDRTLIWKEVAMLSDSEIIETIKYK